jgi:hypothetical protein
MAGRSTTPPRVVMPESAQDYKSLLAFLENESNVRDLNLPEPPSAWWFTSKKQPTRLYADDVVPLIKELTNAIQKDEKISPTSSEKLQFINTMLSDKSRVSTSSKMQRDTDESIDKRSKREWWDSLTPAQRDKEFNKRQQEKLDWEADTYRINAANRAEMMAADAARRCPEHPQFHPSQCKFFSHSVASYLINNPPPKGGRSKRSNNKSKCRSKGKKSHRSRPHSTRSRSTRRRQH